MRDVSQKINQAGRAIQSLILNKAGLGDLAVEYSALVAYEEQLRKARTWPYNTAMLQTVFFTVLIPLLLRGFSELLFGG